MRSSIIAGALALTLGVTGCASVPLSPATACAALELGTLTFTEFSKIFNIPPNAIAVESIAAKYISSICGFPPAAAKATFRKSIILHGK